MNFESVKRKLQSELRPGARLTGQLSAVDFFSSRPDLLEALPPMHKLPELETFWAANVPSWNGELHDIMEVIRERP